MDSLSSWLSLRGALEPGDAVGWVIRAARSLETLHLQGKVHGSVCAEALQIGGGSPSSKGTLARPEICVEYLSPERLKTGRPSAADDAWALALVLYVALTSYHPFEGDDDEDTHEKIRKSPVPPLVAFGIVDESLQQILGRMLERDLLNRVVAVEPFRRSLENWAQVSEAYPPLDGVEDLLASAAELPGHNPLSLSMPPLPLPSLAPGRPSGVIPLPRPSVAPEPPAPRPSSEPPSPRPSSRPAPPRSEEPTEGLTPTAPLPPARSAPPAAPPREPSVSSAPQTTPAPSGGRWGAIAVAGVLLAGGGVWWSQKSATTSPVGVPLEATSSASPLRSAPSQIASSTPRPSQSEAPTPPASSSSAALPPPGSASAAASSSAAVSLPASAHPPTSAAPPATSATSATSAGKAPAGGGQCLLSMFPPDAFSSAPASFASLCGESDPRKGATLIRDEVIRASSTKRSSQVMTEWAVLSWYEMVLFAALQGRCCPQAPPLELPEIKPCTSIKETLEEVRKISATSPIDKKAIEAPLKRFDDGLKCVLRVGATGHYGRTRAPMGDGEEALKQAFARLR